MSEDYETKRTDLHVPAKDQGAERPVVEDPLVELARIVHRNKQSGAHVSSGRVENTDYFAGLDEVAGESAVPSSSEPSRIEPTFAGAKPAAERSDFGMAAKDVHEQPSGAVAAEPAKLHGVNVPAGSEFSSHGGSNVSALWPPQPELTGVGAPASPVSAAPAEPYLQKPEEPYPVDQPETGFDDIADPADKTNLTPSVSLDLEQNLTAELEDELIGALRQSVDEMPEPEDDTQDGASVEAERVTYGGHVQTGYDEPETGFEAEPEETKETTPAEEFVHTPHVAPDARTAYVAPAVELGTGRAETTAHREEPRLDISATPEQVSASRRPEIDENDFFAALNPAHSEAASEDTGRDTQDDGNPAGIDALFADLDFPDPAERKTAHMAPQPVAPQPSAPAERVSAAEIDDMTWPAAAEAVPQPEEDETPPPPEGYDLDAVARAMQESDPSLGGAGVLPPHTAAEKAAMPHARERSRRGLFVAGGVLGIAVIGAAGFFMMDGDAVQVPSGPPPVISGLQEPLKIYPEEAPQTDSDQAKLIYDRVDGNGTSGPDRLILPESPKPAELPPAPAGASGNADLVPGSPKRVRTLVVRPDGSIISEGEQAGATAETPAAAPAPATPAAPSAGTADTPRVVSTTPVVSGNDAQQPAEPAPEAAAPAEAPTAVPEPAAPATPAIVAGTDQETASDSETSQPAAPVPTVLPRKKPAAPVQVARAPEPAATPAPAAQQNGPLNLNQPSGTPAPAAPASPASSSGSIPAGTYIVQVTSQRTAAAASDAYSSLQRRFPAILGNREAVIVSADLGDRGVFYRARIPTASRDEAISLCESLQGAGGDCFVRRQ